MAMPSSRAQPCTAERRWPSIGWAAARISSAEPNASQRSGSRAISAPVAAACRTNCSAEARLSSGEVPARNWMQAMRGFTSALYAHAMMRRAIVLAALASPVGAAPAAANPVVAHFQSPSGNINCIGGTAPAYVECQVRHAAWPAKPPRPIGCDLDWEAYNLSLNGRHR